MLGFERATAAEREVLAALRLLVVARPVGGVDLQAGLGGPDLDEASVERAGEATGADERARLAARRHLALVEHPAVVVALADLEVAVGRVDPLADAPRAAEVERRRGDGLDLAGGDLPRVSGQIALSRNLEVVVLDGAAGLALEVEVDVLGHVDRRRLVGRRLVVDAPDVVLGERVRDLRLDLPGESLVAVGRDVGEYNADIGSFHERRRLPHIRVPAARAAVQVAANAARGVVERRQLDPPAVQLEDAVGDAVAVAADDAAPVGIAAVPAGGRVEADDHVLKPAAAVGREEADDLAAVVGDLHHHSARSAQGVYLRLFPILRGSEAGRLERWLFHGGSIIP